MLTKQDKINFEIWCGKFSNLKKYCEKHTVDIYKIYKQKKNNVILEFAFELMEKLEVNQISYKDFSTTTLSNGVVCATLFNKTIFEIYKQCHKKELTNNFNR